MTENPLFDEALRSRCAAFDENWARINDAVAQAAQRSGRTAADITLLAATKTVPAPVIAHALDCGLRDIGENRVQELLEKYDAVRRPGVRIEMIGHLQTNKVRQIADKVDQIQSVDSLRLAREISRQCAQIHRPMDVLIEVNIGREAQKSGVLPEQLDELIAQVAELPMLTVRGLMTVPPVCDRDADVHKYFSQMCRLFLDRRAKKSDNVYMDCLSMGMSHDFEAAIAEGATMVRIGSALFGARDYSAK